jgi:hypothetical protein
MGTDGYEKAAADNRQQPRDESRQDKQLAAFLLMTILSQAFLSLMGCNLMALSFSSAGHTSPFVWVRVC